MHPISRISSRSPGAIVRSSVLVLLTAAALTGGVHAQTTPSSEPLVQATSMTYLGGFALSNAWPSGTNNTFQYGGGSLAYYNDPKYGPSLYVNGHPNCGSCVGQVQIPSASPVNSANWSSLPMATTIQQPADITQGTLNNIMNGNNGNNNEVYGLLVGNGRILVGANNVYGVDGTISPPGQIADIAVQGSTSVSAGGVFSQWTTVGGSHFVGAIRSQAGWMAWIPSEWQSLVGGDALTGQGAIAVTGTTSSGASANVITSSNVGAVKPVPGITMVYYDVNVAAMCGSKGCEATQNSEFNLTGDIGGMLWVPGTRSILYVGGIGTGPYCYGTVADCGNTDTWRTEVKGPHAPPYRNQVWAFDANDFVKVKNGTLSPQAIQPYSYWALSGMAASPVGNTDGYVIGATIDPNTLRLYMTVDYGTTPRVEVWQINVGTATSSPAPTAVPDPPTAVSVH